MSLTDLKIEYRKLRNDDFSPSPSCFREDIPGEEVRLIRHDNCGMLLFENRRPQYYFHNMNETSSRWSSFIELGEGPLSLQESVHDEDMAQNEETDSYHLISEDPVTYGIRTLSGKPMEFTYNEEGCIWKEGEGASILDVRGEWFPYGLICHMGSEYDIPFIHQPVHLKGTYEGKPVEFLACIDRIFSPMGQEDEIIRNATSYISSYCSGIREDGRREWFMALICRENGKGLGIYYIDKEEPVISGDVINEGIWQRLPYVDDDTVVSIDNVWRFAGKVFHVKGRYGAKGFTGRPRLDRHGQSQIFGTWYEGDTEYRHRIWNTFSENMDAYASSMKERGFRVKE
ncbi:MAG: hypothetical protein K5908_02065 [Erysipelotrichaceae bacterium]|nr:hypothetical protein [Erysipelotrichaceae bacterium]